MPRKRKRNANLSVKKKSVKHTRKDQVYVDESINLDNNNSDIITSSNCSSSSSNCDNSNIISIDSEFATKIISDNEVEEDAPIVKNDLMLEIKMLKQMKQESHRWAVFNFVI